MSGLPKEQWVWMPHPAHLCVAQDCRFHLATYVGGFVVSTVGEYLPDAPVREILAGCRKLALEGRGDDRRADWMRKNGWEEIGAGRTYETMVFRAEPGEESACCPFTPAGGECLDVLGYNDPVAAYKGHLALCEKWAAHPEEE